MGTAISLTSLQVIFLAAGVFLTVGAIIALGRFIVHKRANSDLTKKHETTKWKSPLEARSKYPEVDVLRNSQTFWLAGLALVMVLLLGLFGWTTYEETIDIPDFAFEIEDDIEIEPPRTAEPPPPPPPPPPPVIEEVPEEMLVEDDEEIEFMDQSIDAETEVVAPERPVEAKEDAPPPPPPPPPVEDEEEIFKIVEEMPRFPGCEDMSGTIKERETCSQKKLYQFLYKHIQYPQTARENGIQGKVVVSFVVNKDGSIEQIQILRDPGAGCGEEALRVIELMNKEGIKWIPGRQRGTPVRVQFILPVQFQLA